MNLQKKWLSLGSIWSDVTRLGTKMHMERTGRSFNFYQGVNFTKTLSSIGTFLSFVFLAEFIIFSFFWKWEVSALNTLIAGAQSAVMFMGIGLFMNSRLRAKTAYQDFCWNRIIPMGIRLKKRDPEMPVRIPALRVFRNTDELLDLERRFCEQMTQHFKMLERRRRREQQRVQNDRLRDGLLQTIKNSGLPDDKRAEWEDHVWEDWDLLPLGHARRKRYVRGIEAQLLHAIFQPQMPVVVRPQTSPSGGKPKQEEQKDVRLQFLEQEASGCKSPEARRLYAQAVEITGRRAKIRLFGRAIREERQKEGNNVPESAPVIDIARKNEVRFIELDQLMEEQFQISELIPASVDADMAKEVLLELLDPGSQQRRFQKAYRPESRLKRRVKQRYERWCGGQFDPRSFQTSVSWLLREGVLRSKPKTETCYSLSANMKEARSDVACALIRLVHKLDREIKDM